jgi:hypothetical protein
MGKIFVSINHPAGNKSYNFESFWGGRGRLFHHGGSSSCIFMVPAAKTKLFVLSKRRVGVYLLTARRPNTFARSLISCAARHTIGCRARRERQCSRPLTCHPLHTPTLANPGALRRIVRVSARIAFGTCPLHFQSQLYNYSAAARGHSV